MGAGGLFADGGIVPDSGGMALCIAVASINFHAGFTAFVFLQLKKQLRPGETIVQAVTDHQHDSPFARDRLLALLEKKPSPVALILVALRPPPTVVEAYRARGIPIVIVDEEAPGTTTVAADNFACGRLAVEHLVREGRRSIAVVSGLASHPGGYSALHRLRGVRQALADAGLELAEENVLEAMDYSHKNGVHAMNTLLDRTPRVDGVFCAAGDTTAIGMLEAAQARGIKVPGDLAILSCDNLPCAAIADPPLSSVEQPLAAIAREAYRLVVEERAAILARPRQVLLPPVLVRRQSA